VVADPGTVAAQLAVTGSHPDPTNPATTLKVACVASDGACPAAGATGWVNVTASDEPEQLATLADGTSLVGGTQYACWSAEFDNSNGVNRVCSVSSSSAVAPLAAPTVVAASGPLVNEALVTGAKPVPGNADDVTMKVACINITDPDECPASNAVGWVLQETPVGVQVSTLADGETGLVGGTSYTCWAAQFDTYGNYKCSATGDGVTAALLNRPVVNASPGETENQVSVTGTDSATPNQGTTLQVACVAFDEGCPAYDATGWANVTVSGQPQQISKLADGTTDLVGGESYTCWSLEYQADDPANSICSDTGANVTAHPFNAPTVAASTGTVGGAVLVTGTAPSDANVDAELKVACVEPDGLSGAACPAFDAVGWVAVTNPGVAQQVSTLADGSSMVGNTTYRCYSAEISTHPSVNYGVCSEAGADVTARPLNQPTVVAVSGSVPDQVSVTGTVPSPGNVGTVLKVACVTLGVDCPAFNATGWENVTVSGQPQQVSKLADGLTDLVGGDSYTCYSAEFVGNDRVCSTGSDVMAFAGELKLVPSDSEADARFGMVRLAERGWGRRPGWSAPGGRE
jgi:hypothetical protein